MKRYTRSLIKNPIPRWLVLSAQTDQSDLADSDSNYAGYRHRDYKILTRLSCILSFRAIHLVTMLFLRSFIFHLKTSYLFIRSDIKTILVPVVSAPLL